MSFVRVERPEQWLALVVLDRPERMNAMSFDVMVPLREELEGLGRDADVRAIVLTGAGRGFSSGADQKAPGRAPGVDGLTPPGVGLRAMKHLEAVVTALRGLPQPVIAAVNGAAIGGGLCLALACDLRIAGADAYFRAAGINNGLTATELGLSFLLPRAIGSTRAFDMMLTGRDVDAAEAERIGLVSRVAAHGELLAAADELAASTARFSRLGTELTKQIMWSGLEAGSCSAHMQYEGISQLYVRLLTDNFEEATRARLEGRDPTFRDAR